MITVSNDKEMVTKIKRTLIDISRTNKVGHVASSLSSVEILYTIYSKIANITPDNLSDPERDRVLISKEHCRMGHIAVLTELGLLDRAVAYEWGVWGKRIGHDIFNLIGGKEIAAIDISFGTLGNSLGIGAGMAIASGGAHIYVIAGDGEMQEGSCWEALMFIGYHRLKNITIIIDRNYTQIGGYTKDIIDSSSNLEEQIKSFGFDILVCNGHSVDELEQAFKTKTERPKCIIADTIKGKECRFVIEEKGYPYFHGFPYTESDYEKILEEIN